MGSDIPMYDLEVDYIVGEAFEANLLNGYKNYLSKTESGFFILCVKVRFRQLLTAVSTILVKTPC